MSDIKRSITKNGTKAIGFVGSKACIFENTPRFTGWIDINRIDEYTTPYNLGK